MIRNVEAVCRCLGKRSGESRSVTNGIDTAAATDFKVVAVGPGGIVLTLHSIQQSIVIGRTWRYIVQGVQRFDDIIQLPFGHTQTQISGYRL